MKIFKIKIDETSKQHLKQEDFIYFNTITQEFDNIKDVEEFIIDRYGKIPKKTEFNTIYIDRDNETIEAGLYYSFWNQDCSHNSKKWYQQDWITIEEQEIKSRPVFLN